jgi:hypothetical protein
MLRGFFILVNKQYPKFPSYFFHPEKIIFEHYLLQPCPTCTNKSFLKLYKKAIPRSAVIRLPELETHAQVPPKIAFPSF